MLQQAQDGAPDDPFAKALRQNYNKLDDDKTTALAAIAHLDAEDKKQPAKATSSDLNCLEALPHLQLNLARAPQALLRRLFEITQLTVKVHGVGDQVTITIKLPVDQVPETAVAAERINAAMTSTEMQEVPTASVETSWVEAASTPDGIRTHATGVRGRRPRPLDDGG